MIEPPWLRVACIFAVALYPLLIYFGLQTADPRWLTIILVLIAARFILGGLMSPAMRVISAGCVLVLVSVTLITGSVVGLLFYPVLVNALMLFLFFGSWLKPPTVIEMIARMREPALPDKAIQYTRKLTLVWCAFFVINGSISLCTLALSREWWMLYNGLISYILLGALLFGEVIFRKRILAR